ncbi:N-acetylgalactosamine 6-sulfate sulfatase [bacterium E08(2017)]|nr:N-acetylgalactosamine 6-sulfate sulfatase [bacterium E08(2017)]
MSGVNSRFLSVVLVATFISSGFAARPNVVVILTDDQGWGDLSIHGNSAISTPNIDRLAQEGAQFDRFYVSPVCAPTRAAFLTGRHYVRTGVYGVSRGSERLNQDETTIADMFKAAGYKTACFGKWHNGTQYPYHPNARGFDEFYGFTSGHWGNYYSPILDHNGDIVKGNGYLTDDLTERAMSYIESNRKEPFLVYLAYNTPHSPMQVPDRWWNKFKNMKLTQEHREKDKEHIEHTRAALAMCENIDWNVGRIMDKLDDLKLSQSTIIVYFSDNGPNGRRWNGDMRGKKGSTDEGGVRVPMFMRCPGTIPSGVNVKPICGAYDLLPTLADYAGVPLSGTKALDGKSLKPLLAVRNNGWHDRTLVQSLRKGTSVRTDRFRLDSKGNLFDMLTDPGQYVAVNDKYPKEAERLKKFRDVWKTEMLASYGSKFDNRPFVVGHPDSRMSQLPARDARTQGNIKRSSQHPNDSFLSNWSSVDDRIEWPCQIGASGTYKVEIFYTCSEADVGSTVELSFNDAKMAGKIVESHDPPLFGKEHDRVPRKESYDKDFKRMTLGSIKLEKGEGTLSLRALDIPGSQVMDFRLMLLTRTDG